MRLALGIEYNGAYFHGWQKQPGQVRTVQTELEKALSKVADEAIHTICAGRTDTKVHGMAQVIHFDTEAKRKDLAWVFGTNSFLPPDIRVLWVQPVAEAFHARFSATARTYRYIILNAATHSAILNHLVTWECRPLNLNLMQQATQMLLGTHDFSAFRASECQAKTPLRTVEKLTLESQGEFIYLTIKANAFLQHMVRNIVGTLLDIGKNNKDPKWMAQVLESKNRHLAGGTARANGLYLVKVDYPDKMLQHNAARFPNFS